MALDRRNSKIYWLETSRQEIWRANLDGSEPQTVATNLKSGVSLDVDADHGYVYWTDARFVGTTEYALIRRLKLPALSTTDAKPAPPLISFIEPARQRAGGKVVLHGKHLLGVKNVRLICDDGQQVEAKFTTRGENELTLVVPRRNGIKRAAIALQSLGGVTVTLPRDIKVIPRGDRPYTNFDRFRDDAAFCFVVNPEASFVHVEGSLVYTPADAMASAGGRGDAVLFLKDKSATVVSDARGVIIYHEPFAQIQRRAEGDGDCRLIAVPAIRPSFIESLFEYEEKE